MFYKSNFCRYLEQQNIYILKTKILDNCILLSLKPEWMPRKISRTKGVFPKCGHLYSILNWGPPAQLRQFLGDTGVSSVPVQHVFPWAFSDLCCLTRSINPLPVPFNFLIISFWTVYFSLLGKLEYLNFLAAFHILLVVLKSYLLIQYEKI